MYGVRGHVLELFKSYLLNRKQIVKIIKNGSSYFSDLNESLFGIAQGSIIGPILFIIYLNDIYSVTDLNSESIVCYADDTNLLVGGRNVVDVLDNANKLFKKTDCWFKKNKLIVNNENSNAIMFRTKQSNLLRPDIVECNDKNVNIVDSVKFLGVNIDEFLDWAGHINILLKRLNSACYGIRVVSRYMDYKSVKIMYYANFLSILKYGIIFWGGNAAIQETFIVQKRLLRTMKKMQFRESCRGVFKREGLMTVYGLYIYEALVFFFKNREFFELQISHSYNTRTLNVNYPVHRLALTEKSAYYMCLRLFNKLPNNLKEPVLELINIKLRH